MAKVICLDAGHGGHDGGATANGLKEKDLTLDIAKRIQSKLKNYNVKVIMTRTTDKFLSLTERTNIANRNKADLFLSVHINSGGGTGFESFIYNGSIQKATKGYQSILHSAIMKQIDVKDRGKKTANFAVVRQSNMPAVLTETLFIDTKADANKLKDSKFLNSVAQGHADGIVKQLGLTGSSSVTTSKPSKPSKKPASSKGKANYNTKSIVTFLQSIGHPYSLSHRKKLASYYNVKNYKGQASLNLQLLDLLKKDYKKRGKLRTSKPASNKTQGNKSIAQMAKEVKAGKHGNGHAARRKSLGVSQATYNKVRAEVNKGVTTSKSSGKSVNQIANEIINGKGIPNGHEARRKHFGISKAKYDKVRAEVNRRLK